MNGPGRASQFHAAAQVLQVPLGEQQCADFEFTGYQHLHDKGTIRGLYLDGNPVEAINVGQQGVVVLDKTPFYAESGGQVGDSGCCMWARAFLR